MQQKLTYSKTAVQLTERFEGLRLTAYPDIRGVWTIGYGHTKDVHEGMVWTQDMAEAALIQDLQNTVNCVNTLVTFQLTQPEFDAVVDLVFNIGCTAFKCSTMLRLLNSGAISDAAYQFQLWDHAGGLEVAGLLSRRLAEKQEFENGTL